MKDTSSSDNVLETEFSSIPWIAIPADDIHIRLPMRILDNSVKIKFRDVKAIDDLIEQLQSLKEFI